jgi:hypothetical protein
MNWKTLAIGSILAMFATGCGNNNNPPSTTTAPALPTTEPAVPATEAGPTTPVVTAAPTGETVPAPVVVPAPVAVPTPAVTAPAATMPVAATTAAASATAAASTLRETADKLLADATQAIKDKKWDIADAAVVQLDKYKPNLPAEYGPRIDQLKTALNAAKALSQPGTLPFRF